MKYAFRCRACGNLQSAEHAGRSSVPHACSSCGSGVGFGPDNQKLEEIIAANSGGRSGDLVAALRTALANPVKNLHADNWEVLAEATADRLDELGLTEEQVERHTPVPEHEDLQQDMERIRENLALLEKKQADWIANKDKHVAEYKRLDARLVEIDRAIPAAPYGDQGRLSEERERVRQAMKGLEGLEPTGRDAAHKLHMEARLAEHQALLDGGVSLGQKPKSVFVGSLEGSRLNDQGFGERQG